MKSLLVTLLLLSMSVGSGPAQEETSQGPVWDVQFIRTKPNQREAYLISLKQKSKPIWEEEKRQGLILDYKVFNNLTQYDPHEWDVAVAVQFKNFAALDGFEPRESAIAEKIASKQAATRELAGERFEMREILSTKLIQEIVWK